MDAQDVTESIYRLINNSMFGLLNVHNPYRPNQRVVKDVTPTETKRLN